MSCQERQIKKNNSGSSSPVSSAFASNLSIYIGSIFIAAANQFLSAKSHNALLSDNLIQEVCKRKEENGWKKIGNSNNL